MNYQEFVGSVTGFLRDVLPCGTELNLIPLEKNNGVCSKNESLCPGAPERHFPGMKSPKRQYNIRNAASSLQEQKGIL